MRVILALALVAASSAQADSLVKPDPADPHVQQVAGIWSTSDNRTFRFGLDAKFIELTGPLTGHFAFPTDPKPTCAGPGECLSLVMEGVAFGVDYRCIYAASPDASGKEISLKLQKQDGPKAVSCPTGKLTKTRGL